MFGLEIPPNVQGSFFEAIWKIVRQIPAGKVSTYGQIAGYIPTPDGISPEDYAANRARWAGNAMAASPHGVPWQRVINSQGKISTRKGSEEQRRLLEAEGVIFDQRDRVDLTRYGWAGPSTEWLRENGLLVDEQPKQQSLF